LDVGRTTIVIWVCCVDGDPVVIVAVDGEFVVAPPDVLDEGVAAGHDDDGPGVVGLHSIVGVLVADVAGVG
jgi:hypothetical protein